MKTISRAIVSGAAIGGLLVLTGCAMFRVKVADKDVANLPAYDATYGAQDLRNLSEKVATSIATSDFVKNQPGNLIMIIYGVQPRTTTLWILRP